MESQIEDVLLDSGAFERDKSTATQNVASREARMLYDNPDQSNWRTFDVTTATILLDIITSGDILIWL